MDESVLQSFPPIVDERTRVLIVGSMPGSASLQAQRYYAFPRNHFWRLMYGLWDEPYESDYAFGLQMLARRGVGLWDVLASCRRPGSLDQHITDAAPNDFGCLFERYSHIRYIGFNGQTAYTAFKRDVGFRFSQITDYAVLPSSSPANTMRFERKLEQWRIIRQFVEAAGGNEQQ